MSKTSEPKMKSFNIGTIAKRPLSRRDQEKLKKKEEEKAAAEVYEDFVASFDEPANQGKLFVRGTVINPDAGDEKSTPNSGKLYKPAKMAELQTKKEDSRSSTHSNKLPALKKEKAKKKSNLEMFKEELKVMQLEREERHKMKNVIKETSVKPSRFEPIEPLSSIKLADDYRLPVGSFDAGDPTTTNLYLGNINPKMSEQQLCEIFGRFGPLASVKIMWPRSDEEKSRGRNCGFVAYMNRLDGERALSYLKGRDIMDYEMKLGWGKAVPIPPHPIYIPPKLLELTMPPPPSCLPFNAQPHKMFADKFPLQEPFTKHPDAQKILNNAVVKVVIPTERNLLCLIHRMIEFVVREGPMFEAMIMNREINNAMFRFLFENQSPAHVYYRWKMYSILQGDAPNNWRTEEFRMFQDSSLWKPPPLNPYHQGMPEELISIESENLDIVKASSPPPPQPVVSKKGQLSNGQRDRFESMLRTLSTERSKMADLMVYCVEHAEASEEIVECIAESLSILETPLQKKVARLYLISDILHNCCVKVANVHFYRKNFQDMLPEIFFNVRDAYDAIEGRLKAEQFKQKIMQCFRAWEDWAIYPSDYLIRLQNIFLGLIPKGKHKEAPPQKQVINSYSMHNVQSDHDDIDGAPFHPHLDGDELVDDNIKVFSDIDGIPFNDEVDGEPMGMDSSKGMKYAPSKWETVDPDMVEAQAMTTSKWDTLEEDQNEDEIDGKPMEDDNKDADYGQHDGFKANKAWIESLKTDINKERRTKLREIEVKVMKFQDELESGKRSKKPGVSLAKQVEHYREKLIKKVREKENEKRDERKRDRRSSPSADSPSYKYARESSPGRSKSNHKVNSPSPRLKSSSSNSASRSLSHRSRSPPSWRSRRSRSRSPYRPERRSRSPSPSFRSKSRKKKTRY